MRSDTNIKKGFSAAELIISVAIVAGIVVVFGAFQRDIFFYNSISQENLSTQMNGRQAVKRFLAEVREASPSSLGAYPIVQIATSSLTFFSDIDNDGLKERVRYFKQGTNLRRGVIKPTGNPLVYNSGSETLTTVIPNVSNNNATPIFDYFASGYTETTAPLTLPTNVLNVRLVRINVIIEKDAARLPPPLTITSQVAIRNIKDNL